jgi:preprotein translocase subunit SecA
MPGFMDRVLRVGEGKRLKALESATRAVNSFEPDMEARSDEELRDRYQELRDQVLDRIEQGDDVDVALADVQPEAFALVREVGRRTLGMRHFDVQIMGGFALADGMIAEMKTGEGKTLVATLAACHRAMAGRGVHIITVNDYLARRDADWMGPLYRGLGVTVGVIQAEMDHDARKAAYACDITYGTNSEFGFDYLRDNLAVEMEACVQRGHYYGIVDEVDSILIDEARTPLIISGQPEEAAATYYEFARIAKRLQVPGDYEVDEKRKTVAPTEAGVHKVERALGVDNLYAPGNGHLVNHLVQSLKAESLFHKDVEYVVRDGEVKIVDEFTGRIMEGRRWSEGLHQAVEAKEGVKIEAENLTVATITIQNYFRMYETLAGMTGTAATEANEFAEIYKLDVVSIPPNVPMVRDDQNDVVFKTQEEKFNAVADDIQERHKKGQPVLVGTISIEVSEMLSKMLVDRGVPHNVLNAKHHEKEAAIIAEAGQPGAVTIATNMAGRGVDIKLGEGVPDLGGLYVLGTERHESRRIDNQLRGRSGRQGDPGESRFYLSAEDEVVRLFAGDRIYKILDRLGPPEGEPIEHGMLTKRIEGAQRRVEEMHFESRKNVLKYDDVLNSQREKVYAERRLVLEGQDISDLIREWIDETVWGVVDAHTSGAYSEEWDLDAMMVGLRAVYPIGFTLVDLGPPAEINRDELLDRVAADAQEAYKRKETIVERIQPGLMRQAERFFLLQSVDHHWREHLDAMEYLRDGIHLRGLAQRDPLVEYRTEGHAMFQAMMREVEEEVVSHLFHVTFEVAGPDGQSTLIDPFASEDPLAGLVLEHESGSVLDEVRAGAGNGQGAIATELLPTPVEQRRVEHEIGRNDPCWCGSGKKYKRCHGAAGADAL